MRTILTILLLSITVMATDCRELYDGFLTVLEPQMTVMCKTQMPGTYGYKFYVQDEKTGYINAMLVFNENNFYLYFEGIDENPFKCTDDTIYRTERPQAILKVLFAPRLATCEKEFLEAYRKM
jgi:hypothetical protein